jgi:hypothetical protein
MFDPLENARYAARFLAELQQETGDWMAAVGAYHSRTPELAAAYRSRVETLHRDFAGAALSGDQPPQPSANGYPLLQAGAARGAGSLVPDVAGPGSMFLRVMPGTLFGG